MAFAVLCSCSFILLFLHTVFNTHTHTHSLFLDREVKACMFDFCKMLCLFYFLREMVNKKTTEQQLFNKLYSHGGDGNLYMNEGFLCTLLCTFTVFSTGPVAPLISLLTDKNYSDIVQKKNIKTGRFYLPFGETLRT